MTPIIAGGGEAAGAPMGEPTLRPERDRTRRASPEPENNGERNGLVTPAEWSGEDPDREGEAWDSDQIGMGQGKHPSA